MPHRATATSAEGASAKGEGTLTITERNTLSLTAGSASLAAGKSGQVTVDVTNDGPSDADTTTVAGIEAVSVASEAGLTPPSLVAHQGISGADAGIGEELITLPPRPSHPRS